MYGGYKRYKDNNGHGRTYKDTKPSTQGSNQSNIPSRRVTMLHCSWCDDIMMQDVVPKSLKVYSYLVGLMISISPHAGRLLFCWRALKG